MRRVRKTRVVKCYMQYDLQGFRVAYTDKLHQHWNFNTPIALFYTQLRGKWRLSCHSESRQSHCLPLQACFGTLALVACMQSELYRFEGFHY